MKKRHIILNTLILSTPFAMIQADTLISFGGDYGSASPNFSRSATGSGSGPYTEYLAFDMETVLSPGGSYSGPAFYGGYQFSSTTVNGILNRQQIRDGGANDRIYLQSYSATGWEGSELSLHAAFMFKQADFAAGHQSGSTTITGISIGQNSFSGGTGRFMVEIGGNYYVSQSSFVVSGSASLDLNGSALESELWADYMPNVDLNFDQTATFSALALSDVTGVGFYLERDSFAGSSGSTPYGIGIESFVVTGTTTVPEPAQTGLILGVCAVALGAFARRR